MTARCSKWPCSKWPPRLAGVLAAWLCASAPAGAQSIIERCFPPDALAAREGERSPRKGAPGHQQPIPAVETAPARPVALHLRGAVRRVALPRGVKLVALTLDLCEQAGEIAGYDGDVFDLLRRHGVRATVFTGGKWMLTHGERTQQLMADPRFEIGSHGWAHRNVRGLAGAALRDEMEGPQAAWTVRRAQLSVRQCVAEAPPAALARVPARLGLYRFPFGACNPEALALAAERGMLAIQWDVSTGDSSRGETAEDIARNIVDGVRPGSIVLAHANGRGHHTAAGLAIAIPKLLAKGYRFVTVSELVAAGRPVITEACYDRRPGDTDRYDALLAPAAATAARRRHAEEPRNDRAAPPALPR